MVGVRIFDLPVIRDERGWVQLLAIPSMPQRVIGEVYASGIYRGAVKGWHMHMRMTLCYVCVEGEVEVSLYDDRDLGGVGIRAVKVPLRQAPSPFYRALVIPPFVWNGFRIPEHSAFDHAMIINCADMGHDPEEIQRKPPDAFGAYFDWGKYEVGG
jgi:dTDP-4-dehydrorhamnose 3,5-epimerase